MPQWASAAPAELLPGWWTSWPTVPKATCSALLHPSTPQSSYCRGEERRVPLSVHGLGCRCCGNHNLVFRVSAIPLLFTFSRFLILPLRLN